MVSIIENEPLAPYTTFKLGGPARYFASVTSREDVREVLAFCSEHNLALLVLAGGSNMLIADEGFDGCVMHIALEEYECNNTQLVVGAGNTLATTILTASRDGLCGFQSMYGIPGSVGGALRGNAGAFGTEMKDVVTEVEGLNMETHEVRMFNNSECEFGYRTSFFKEHPEWLVLSVTFTLTHGDPSTCEAHAHETLAKRESRQLQAVRTAGSFFQNPRVPSAVQQQFADLTGNEARDDRVPAGWLIDIAGLRGYCIGGVCTGEQSANYILNTHATSAMEVYEFACEMQRKVRAHSAVVLTPEVTLVGFDDMV